MVAWIIRGSNFSRPYLDGEVQFYNNWGTPYAYVDTYGHSLHHPHLDGYGNAHPPSYQDSPKFPNDEDNKPNINNPNL